MKANKKRTKIHNSYRLNFIIFCIVFALIVLTSCSSSNTVKIAFSKASGSANYQAYIDWVLALDNKIECIDLYNMSFYDALKALDDCSGLILTGGPDVHPDRYGKNNDTSRCEIDVGRDTLEFALINKALEMELPIFAICRGEQILNVAKGGTLIVDIPADYGRAVIHRCEDPSKCFHNVNIVDGALLNEISNVKSSLVNSNHHQAVERLANDFVASAISDDGLIEAFEYKEHTFMPFLLAVQWHPERLGIEHPLSGPLLDSFIENARNFRKYVTK
jgi:putative glutamine amidotransferase